MRSAAIGLLAVALSACVSGADEPDPVIVGPGATEADFLASLSDEELYPDLSPEGAAVMRAFLETPASSFAEMLDLVILGFDCGQFPVNEENLPRFGRFVGETLLRANAMPEDEIPLMADAVGETVVIQGMARLPEDLFLYDADGALTGLARCA